MLLIANMEAASDAKAARLATCRGLTVGADCPEVLGTAWQLQWKQAYFSACQRIESPQPTLQATCCCKALSTKHTSVGTSFHAFYRVWGELLRQDHD